MEHRKNLENGLQLIEIEGKEFSVKKEEENIQFNLTLMCSSFGEECTPEKWIALSSTKEYLKQLSIVKKFPVMKLVEKIESDDPMVNGFWAMDQHIAIRFAQWLDMRFSVLVEGVVSKIVGMREIVVEPFLGVYPLIVNGEPLYCYLEVLKAVGFSAASGAVQERKKKHAEEFEMYMNRNFITLNYCRVLEKHSKEYHETHPYVKVKETV